MKQPTQNREYIHWISSWHRACFEREKKSYLTHACTMHLNLYAQLNEIYYYALKVASLLSSSPLLIHTLTHPNFNSERYAQYVFLSWQFLQFICLPSSSKNWRDFKPTFQNKINLLLTHQQNIWKCRAPCKTKVLDSPCVMPTPDLFIMLRHLAV